MSDAPPEPASPAPPDPVQVLIRLVPPLCLFAWRFLGVRGTAVWADWAASLAVYGIFLVLVQNRRAQSWGTFLFGTYLLGLYFLGQSGHALKILAGPF